MPQGGAISLTAVDIARMARASVEHAEFTERCKHCGNPAYVGTGLKTCRRCKSMRYCSVDCQRAHWRVHKPDCKEPAPKAKVKKSKKEI